MGQARLVTVSALALFGDMKREVMEGTDRGEITPFRASRIAQALDSLASALVFAHNRAAVASLALRDVRDVRNIENACAKARISPLTFDLGPGGPVFPERD